jgi:2-hydroxy-3-oxopropionate reductase
MLGGLGASPILDGHGARMLRGDFEPGGAAKFHRKDISAIAQMADLAGLSLPLFEAVRAKFEALLAQANGGDLDHAAVYQRYPHQ